MNNKLIVVENFFDDPDSVRNCALNILSSQHDNFFNDNGHHYPACRSIYLQDCAPHIQEELKTKVELHTGQKYKELLANVYIINSVHGCGMPHYDGKYHSAGVIYLNEISPANTGTKVVKSLIPGVNEHPELLSHFNKSCLSKDYNVVKDFANLKKIRNKECYEDSIVVHAEYNRLVTYDAKFLHTPDNYFGFNLYNSRLTIAFVTEV